MKLFNSLRFKIFSIILIIIAPLFALLLFNNFYAMNVVRNQVTQSYRNLLPLYVQKMDDSMDEIESYLMNVVKTNEDFLSLNRYPQSESDDYLLNRQRVINSMNNDINYYKILNSLFVYSEKTDTLLISNIGIKDYENQYEGIRKFLIGVIKKPNDKIRSWQLIMLDQKYQLIKFLMNDAGVYYGATVNIEALVNIKLISYFNNNIGVYVLTKSGIPVIVHNISKEVIDSANRFIAIGYRIARDNIDKRNYLVLSSKSVKCDLFYSIAVDEEMLLMNLPFFQRMIYLLPLVIVLILLSYFLSLQRVLFKPMYSLIKGMRKIGSGNLDTRIKESGTNEFHFLIRTFNDMVSQICDLKINVYEEKINAQKAELKHLQIQINPHFYANTLNIVYNLAALKDYNTIQKLSLYLANHFRYLMNAGQATIKFEEEIKYVENYLQIQKIRFHDRIEYNINVPNDLMTCNLPPLTIQTLVENSVIHGFKDAKTPLFIGVVAKKLECNSRQYLEIIVRDNGVGFPEHLLADINKKDSLKDKADANIGLWNIYSRLKMYFGEESELQFFNEESNRCAAARLIIPIEEQVN